MVRNGCRKNLNQRRENGMGKKEERAERVKEGDL